MQMLNIYEFYYTFYSWNTYELVYQLFWSTKLIFLPFLLFFFQAIKITVEKPDEDGVNKGLLVSFIIMFVTFLIGTVPTVPLRVNDALVNFVECDIQVSSQEILNNTEESIGTDKIKIPIVPYFMYAVGTGVTNAIGNNLSCMQSVAVSLESTSSVPVTQRSENPNLAEIHNTYLTQCKNKADEFTSGMLNNFDMVKIGSIFENYVDRTKGQAIAKFFGSTDSAITGDRGQAKNQFRRFLTNDSTNSSYLREVVYAGSAQDVINKFNEVGSKNNDFYNDKDKLIMAMNKTAQERGTGFVSAYGASSSNARWSLNTDDEDYIRKNIPLVARLSKSEHDYVSQLGNEGSQGYGIQVIDSQSCSLSDAEKSGDNPIGCYDCAQLGKVVLDTVAKEQAKAYIAAQMANWKGKDGYTHPVVVRPTATKFYNDHIAKEKFKGTAEEQREQLRKLVEANHVGFLVDQADIAIMREMASGEIGPPELVEKYSNMLLDQYPQEIGNFSNEGNYSISRSGREGRDAFLGGVEGAAIAGSMLLTKGGAFADMLMKYVEVRIAKALMLQIIPMVLMLYIIFWVPFMVIGMYSPKTLVQGSALFFAIKLLPLFTIIITSTTSDLASILDYNHLDKLLIDLAATIMITFLPIIVLSFLAAAFGSAISGSIIAASTTGTAAIAATRGGRGLSFEKKDKDKNKDKDKEKTKS